MRGSAAKPLTREEAEALFERRRRCYLERDVEGYLALWADDMEIELPRREPLRGKAAYRRLVERSFAELSPESFEIHRLAVEGSHVLSEWTIRARRRADGRSIRWDGMAVCRIARGRIEHWREYWDPAQLR
ncbi:MAG: nuclear transport factor 2 family protein [Myxococcota bacterium]